MQKGIHIVKESILIVTLLSILTVGFLFYMISGIKEVAMLPKNMETYAAFTASSTPVSLDADTDGLLDWEEALWGTDPRLADSDTDGTTDGDEVRLNRNPRKPGPNDASEGLLLDISEPRVVQSRVQQPKRTETPAAKEVLPTTTALPLPASDPELKAFGNELATLIMNTTNQEAETAFWKKAVGNTKMTTELLQGFSELAKKYAALAGNIGRVPTPGKAAGIRNGLQTAYQGYADAVGLIAKTPTGSYMSKEGVTAYAERTLALARAAVAVSDFFYAEHVVFSKNEPGNIFMFPR